MEASLPPDTLQTHPPEGNSPEAVSPGTERTGDQRLWQQFREGDRQAFARIYTEHTRDLFRYGTRITPDEDLVRDCLQELFVELWNARHRLSPTDSIRYYLMKGLKRKLVKALTHSRLHSGPGDAGGPYPEDVTSPYEELLIEAQSTEAQKTRLSHALGQLTKRQREAITLRFFNELSYPEIAAAMSLTPQSVYNLVYLSLETLKKSLLFWLAFGGAAALFIP